MSAGADSFQTRRALLTAGAAGAGAAASIGLLSPSESDTQVIPPDDRYVWRSRMPINVKDHGAKGDGTHSPSDDTGAIQAAINAVPAGGGTVYIPPGDYVVNGTLLIPAGKPVRILGAGMGLMGTGAAPSFGPTRLIRRSPTTDNIMLKAWGTPSNRVWLELSDLEFHGAGRPATILDIQVANTAQLHRIRFSGATATGVRMRNVYNSSGSHLRFVACGNGPSQPAVVFDGVNGPAGGSDTVQWDTLQFEGNGGTDLKLTGNSSNEAGTVTTACQFSNVKMEGGAAPGCPYIDLDYSQGCFFSNVHIGVHGGRNATPLRKNHPFGGTRADKFVNIHIDSVGSDSFPYGIEHSKGGLQLENITVLGASTAAIKVNSTVGANEFQLGNLLTNMTRAIIDSRTSVLTVASAGTVTAPRAHYVSVTGSTTITRIEPHEAGYVMTLAFSGAPTVVAGGNLRLAGNFVAGGNDTLTLVSDGSNWYEVARSVNT